MADSEGLDWPQPFYEEWSRTRRPAAQALWHWHSALVEPAVPQNVSREAFFDEERARAAAGESLQLMEEATWSTAYDACAAYDLDRELLGAQVEASRVLVGPTRFESTDQLERFIRLWAVPHARLLAGLADLTYSAQIGWVDELARGFFHFSKLVSLREDLARDRLFFPLEELGTADVTVDQLRDGRLDDGVRRLLWKKSVRVRDALAQGRALVNDLGFRHRYALKRYWMGMLAVLNELERRDFDLWAAPLDLSLFRRAQVYLQMVFGRLHT